MKKLLSAAACILLAGVLFGQSIHEGSILGVHHMTVTLEPDVSMDQFLDHLKKTWIPEVEKHLDGWKGFIVKGNKGEHKNEYGIVWYIESIEDHDKYHKTDGTPNEAMEAIVEELQPVIEESAKLGTWTSTYTDWIIQ